MPDWLNGHQGQPAEDSNAFEAYLEEAAPETIETAWRMVIGNEALPDEVKQIASETLAFSGAQGIAGLVVVYNASPLFAVADALAQIDRDDPRKGLFVKAGNDVGERGQHIFEFGHRHAGSLRDLMRWQQRFTRRHYRAPRAGSRPRRRSPRSRNGTRSPPADPDRPREQDDPDELDLEAGL